ncbi:MAG TPA: type 4a pilus biogenesis protein PilO [Gaiellaceae bacterium]|nr:type 4a pilus biogenesis protein PilO [Gaiellaceae bacterium]
MKRQVPMSLVAVPALLLVAAIGFFLLVKPQMDESAALDERIAELQGKVDVALAAESRTAPEERIEVADLFRLTKAMPDSTDMAGMILELDGVAESAGVDFISITPTPPVARGSGFQAVPIQVTFEGNYYDLTDFLFRLRNLVVVRDGELQAGGRLFTLDALDIQKGSQGLPQVQAVMTISAYRFDPAATVPATAAPPASTTATPPATDPATLGAG